VTVGASHDKIHKLPVLGKDEGFSCSTLEVNSDLSGSLAERDYLTTLMVGYRDDALVQAIDYIWVQTAHGKELEKGYF